MGFERFQPSQSSFSTADLNSNVLLLLAVVLLTGTFLLGGVLFFHLVRSYERDSMPPPQQVSTFPVALRDIQHGISIPEASGCLDDTTINSLPIFMHKNYSVPYGSGDDEGEDDVHGLTSFLENECSICLGEYEDEEMVRVMPECGHSFHSGCVDGWLRSRFTCSLCRLSLDSSSTGVSAAIS